MGGIKNKLSKLIYEPPFRKRRQMKSGRISIGGFDRVSKFTKYTSIACLSLAILSTIALNLISTYSSSNIESNAEPVGDVSTLANIDPASISISISSYSYPSSSSTGGGGIATGRHTVTVSTGSSVIGYELQLSSNSDETGLVNNDASDNEGSTSSEGNPSSNPTIPTTTGIITNPSQLADRTYGYTLANLDDNNNLANANIWIGLKPSTNPDTITTVDESNLTIGQANTTVHNIYYGVNIQNPVETRAGDYTRQVVYTVVGELMLEPVISSVSPSRYAINLIRKAQVVNRTMIYALATNGNIYKNTLWNDFSPEYCHHCDSKTIDFAISNDGNSTVMLDSDGNLLSFGGNTYGQLGDGTTDSRVEADAIVINDQIASVYSGANNFLAVSKEGRLYTWGRNEYGLIGTATTGNLLIPVNITEAFQLNDNEKIISADRAGANNSEFSVALTNNGRIFTWGNSGFGKLGDGNNNSGPVQLPTDITDKFNLQDGEKIIEAVAGESNMAYAGHVIALTNYGGVFTWGYNGSGQLGNGNTVNSSTPIDITDSIHLLDSNDVVKHVFAANNTSWAVTAKGEVLWWGASTGSTTPTGALFSNITDWSGRISFKDIAGDAYMLTNNGQLTVISPQSSSIRDITNFFINSTPPLVTLTGSNFSNVNNVYIDLNRDDAMQANEQCTDLTINSDTELTCNVPTDNNIATGDYTMYIETPYNYTTTTFRYQNYSE